jgi:hypothetical protein
MDNEPEIYLRPIDNRPLTAEELHLLGAGVTTVQFMTRDEFAKRYPPSELPAGPSRDAPSLTT